MSRLGKKRGTGSGRRQVVWAFVCPMCGNERAILAKRRPTGDPDDVPSLICSGTAFSGRHEAAMENRGLFFLSMIKGHRAFTPAAQIRREWDRLREKMLRGKMCSCGHWRLDHKPMEPYPCGACECLEFRPQVRQVIELGFDQDVPF